MWFSSYCGASSYSLFFGGRGGKNGKRCSFSLALLFCCVCFFFFLKAWHCFKKIIDCRVLCAGVKQCSFTAIHAEVDLKVSYFCFNNF